MVCFRKKLVNLKSGVQNINEEAYVVKFISKNTKNEVCNRRIGVLRGFKKNKKSVIGFIEIKKVGGTSLIFQVLWLKNGVVMKKNHKKLRLV